MATSTYSLPSLRSTTYRCSSVHTNALGKVMALSEDQTLEEAVVDLIVGSLKPLGIIIEAPDKILAMVSGQLREPVLSHAERKLVPRLIQDAGVLAAIDGFCQLRVQSALEAGPRLGAPPSGGAGV